MLSLSDRLTHAPARRGARRLATAGAATLAALSLLAGCAGAPAADTPAAETAAGETAGGDSSAAGQNGTIEFSYEGYEATLPADPERVVVLDSRAGLELALLAEYPIVATAYGTDSPLSPLVDADTAHLKNSAFDLNREEIAAYKPDLIVVGTGWWDYYEGEDFKLGEIAPVLAVNDGIDVAGASIDEPFVAMTEQLAQLGRADQAEAAIADYEAAVDSARERIGDYAAGKTATVIHAPVDNFTVISDDSIYQVVLPALGLRILENEQIDSAPLHASGEGRTLSYENAVSALGDADLAIVFKAERDASIDPLLKRVPAVESGNWIEGNLAERFGFALTYTSFVNGVADAIEAFPNE